MPCAFVTGGEASETKVVLGMMSIRTVTCHVRVQILVVNEVKGMTEKPGKDAIVKTKDCQDCEIVLVTRDLGDYLILTSLD